MKTTDSIAILGYGVEGKVMCEYLLRHGYTKITICDQSETLGDLPAGVTLRGGADYLKNLQDFDIIFRSPGISFFKPEIQAVQEKMTSMTRYFFEHCPCKIVGVTGTKGKGTTSSLIADMLRRAERAVFLGGNIGVPAVSFLDDLTEDAIVILELSSFQLSDLDRSPSIAVVLNVTSEHLDYHASVEEYRHSKYPILSHQRAGDIAILNADYPYAKEFAKLSVASGAQVMAISTKRADVKGASVHNGYIFLGEKQIIRTGEVGLLGKHNLENILPAATVARALGVNDLTIHESIRDFRGLPHRLEFVTSVGDVTFYNDSFSTTPESCIAASTAFNDINKPFFLIAGGSEKGSDFTELARSLSTMESLQKIFLMGPSGARIGTALAEAVKNRSPETAHLILCEPVESLKEAFEKAYADAVKLETPSAILMSPAAASFNEFKNYKERGEHFKDLARSL